MLAIVVISIFYIRFDIPDDAFITLRLANNLVHGLGWDYNPGAPSDIATSPFYVIYLIPFLFAFKNGHIALLMAYGVGLFIITTILYVALREKGRSTAFVVAISSLMPPFLIQSVGMETAIYLAVILLAAFFFNRRDYGWSGLFSGLAALSRPEGILILLVLTAFYSLRERKVPWKLFVTGGLVIAPWLFFSYWDFGSIVSHTAQVKATQDQIQFLARESWIAGFYNSITHQIILIPLFLMGVFYALEDYKSGDVFLSVVLIFCIMQVIGYALLHAPAGYFWYYVPGDFVIYTLASYGASRLLSRLAKHNFNSWLLVGGIFFASLMYWQFKISKDGYPLFRDSRDYISAAVWLHNNAANNDYLAADEIGYVGYYSGLRIRDMMGLVDLESIGPLKKHRWNWWYSDYNKPTYVLLHKKPWLGEPGCPDTPFPVNVYRDFLRHYKIVLSTKNIILLQYHN